ncbi:NAD-dependent epimerase/dehydratase family protein [Enterococcus avium]|uniref:NAD-dependent epimerase/dehydratase family protein n=1 Tax=Enterococcus avium TaxID=33945 RepID=UPI001A9572C1|nr:NAD-dependent epimerase/dehydratase family protein [Enterococcus avium]MBO1138450.1 NAD-dependent epimerase/dehydratase family protein [Enterococcus avium]MDT2479387.1 NAD-dependent epimerase/dehydratase family protein [Enterococcus avium]
MQTILGSNGQIGYELAKELSTNYTKELRLVSRKPKKINPTDQLVSADLMDYAQTKQAIEGSEIVYFTVGLPMDSELWETNFMQITKNVVRACEESQSKLVFFDNTYMYPKDSTPQKEGLTFSPKGRKAVVRSDMANFVLKEMEEKRLEAVICRAPEFYGPEKTQSITNTLFLNAIKANKTAKIPVNKTALRTLIWTPDASRAMALIGNTPSAYGQSWHLPCDEPHTYMDMLAIAEKILDRPVNYKTIPLWQFKLAKPFSKEVSELDELLPRYAVDNLFVSDKFKTAFPDFTITTLEEGLTQLFSEMN